jgi:hypothetical protein
MPFLHFVGNFTYQLPYYNNFPEKNAEVDNEVLFKDTLNPEQYRDLRNKIGGDFTKYFELEFKDVQVSAVTYNDGSYIQSKENDSIIESKVLFKAFLVDISPHLECGRLYPIIYDEDDEHINYRSFGIVEDNNSPILYGIPRNKEKKTEQYAALQSDLHQMIRLEDRNLSPMFLYSGSFKMILDDIKTSFSLLDSSQFLRELGNIKESELYFHLSHFNFTTCTGKIKGYLGPIIDKYNIKDKDNFLRLQGRRLILNTDISNMDIKKDFKLNLDNLYADYDLYPKNKFLILRYLDLIPLVRSHIEQNKEIYDPPENYIYIVGLADYEKKDFFLKIGDINLNLNDFNNFKNWYDYTSILIFKIPDEANRLFSDESIYLKIKVGKINTENEISNYDSFVDLLIESPLDMVIEKEIDRGLVVSSGEVKEISARVYYKNKPKDGHKVYLMNDRVCDISSPIVVRFTEKELYTQNGGKINATINALDIENLPSVVYDPVDDKYFGTNSKNKMLPWNRYYGNYIYLKIKKEENDTDYIQEIKLPVRVLHSIKEYNKIPRDYIEESVLSLFQYYNRYYPWLHIKFNNDRKKYERLVNLNLSREIPIEDVIERLEKNVNDEKKMPRSRDFPIGGLELIKRWYNEIVIG